MSDAANAHRSTLRVFLARVAALLGGRPRGCSCDWRFVGIAHDVDCPLHGLSAALAELLDVDSDAGGLLVGSRGNAAQLGIDGCRRRQILRRRAA